MGCGIERERSRTALGMTRKYDSMLPNHLFWYCAGNPVPIP